MSIVGMCVGCPTHRSIELTILISTVPSHFSQIVLNVSSMIFLLSNSKLRIIRICQLVEGLPLAIELAASWLKTLSCQQIIKQIERGIDFFATRVRDVPERHRSIRAVFDHSWNLLTEEERVVFPRLSVFRGGFTLEAAEQVAEADLTIMAGLVEKSMIRRDNTGRYDLHELLRQYAEEYLQLQNEVEAINLRHMTYFAMFMADRLLDVKGRRQIEALKEIKVDFSNIQVAWDCAVEYVDYDVLEQITETLTLYCDMRGLYLMGDQLLQSAIKRLWSANQDYPHHVFIRIRVSYIHIWTRQHGDTPTPEPIQQDIDDCLAYAYSKENPKMIAFITWVKGELAGVAANQNRGIVYAEQARSYYEEMGDDYYVGRILRDIVLMLMMNVTDQLERAKELNQILIEILRQNGDRCSLAHAIQFQSIHIDHEESIKYVEESIALARETGDSVHLAHALFFYSEDLFLMGQFNEAKQANLEGLSLFQQAGYQSSMRLTLIQGLLAVIDGQFNIGLQHLEGWITKRTEPKWHPEPSMLINCLPLAMLALMDKKNRNNYMIEALTLVQEFYYPVVGAGCLAVAALISAEKGDSKRAVQRLGLAFTQSESLSNGLDAKLGSPH